MSAVRATRIACITAVVRSAGIARRAGIARIAAALVLSLTAAATSAIEIGQTISATELQSVGVPQLAALKGKVVYLDFWASWCGPCRRSFPWMNDMQKKYSAQGLRVVAMNLDANRADANRFLAETPARFALGFDADAALAKRFGIKGMPTAVLIGADGKVLAVHQGFRAEDRGTLEASFVAALDAVPHPTETTR